MYTLTDTLSIVWSEYKEEDYRDKCNSDHTLLVISFQEISLERRCCKQLCTDGTTIDHNLRSNYRPISSGYMRLRLKY